MNYRLFKYNLKRHWKFILGFAFLIVVYLGIIISLIDPSDMEKIKQLFGAMGKFLEAFGISVDAMTSPLAYTASTFFGALSFMFVVAYQLILIIPLFIKPVSNTSIAYFLSQPISRKKYLLTQIIFLIFSMAFIFLAMLLISVIMLSTKGNYNFFSLLNLIGIMFFMNLAVAILAVLFAVIFIDSKKATMITAFVPGSFLFLSIIGNLLKEKTKFIIYLTPFGWIDPVKVVNQTTNPLFLYIIFLVSIVSFSYISILIFNKKRLSV